MKILVTGGAGFIGSHVVDAYVAAGHEVAVLDDLSTGSEANVHREAKLLRLDVRDKAGVAAAIAAFHPEVVNHHAAQAEVPKSVADPGLDAMINIVGGLNVLKGKEIMERCGSGNRAESVEFFNVTVANTTQAEMVGAALQSIARSEMGMAETETFGNMLRSVAGRGEAH